jgi:signal transduction histidine kinase
VRLAFCVIVSYSLTSLRAARARQEELTHFLVHDLRSPLSNVLAGLNLVLDAPDDAIDPENRELLGLSVASSHRMLSLINSLLDMAKLESGKLKLAPQPTDLQPMFDTALDQVSAMALRTEVKVFSEIEVGAESVLADADLTVRVLVNLLSNALKYSPTSGSVRLSAALYGDGKVALRICDEGMGIAPEWVDKVFGKFSQVEARKAGAAIGSGLGLTFCRLAVEAQGGRIWLESEVGKGTTVIFTLPRSSQS